MIHAVISHGKTLSYVMAANLEFTVTLSLNTATGQTLRHFFQFRPNAGAILYYTSYTLWVMLWIKPHRTNNFLCDIAAGNVWQRQ